MLNQIFDLFDEKSLNIKLNYAMSSIITESILSLKYPDTDMVAKWNAIFKPDQKKDFQPLEFAGSVKIVDSIDSQIGSYFDSMSVKYETPKQLGGLNFPFYLPDQKMLIFLLSREDINFDRLSIRGRGLLNLRLANEISSKSDLRLITLSLVEFYQNKEDMARVLYLESKGISSLTAKDKYDFSNIHRKTDNREETEAPKKLEEELPLVGSDSMTQIKTSKIRAKTKMSKSRSKRPERNRLINFQVSNISITGCRP